MVAIFKQSKNLLEEYTNSLNSQKNTINNLNLLNQNNAQYKEKEQLKNIFNLDTKTELNLIEKEKEKAQIKTKETLNNKIADFITLIENYSTAILKEKLKDVEANAKIMAETEVKTEAENSLKFENYSLKDLKSSLIAA